MAINTHLKGLLITTVGVLFIVPDSLFVRLIQADPLVIALMRGLTSGLLVLALILIFRGSAGFLAVFQTGLPGIIYIVLLGSTTPAFVFAVAGTSVANVVFIFASTPMFAAIFSWFFLGERIRKRMILTLTFVVLGLGVIGYGTGSTSVASLQGDLWALYVAVAYAAALTAVRQVKHVSMIPAIPIAYIGAALVLMPFADPLPAFQQQWPLFLGHGLFIGVAAGLLTLGPRYLSSAEVSLLLLLESVLAPLLAWFVIGENPGKYALIGGSIVIGTLLVSNVWAYRKHGKRNT